jgi:hypothetical protein
LARDAVNGLTATSRAGRWEWVECGLVRRYLGLWQDTGLKGSGPATDGGEVLNNRRHTFGTLGENGQLLKQTKCSA